MFPTFHGRPIGANNRVFDRYALIGRMAHNHICDVLRASLIIGDHKCVRWHDRRVSARHNGNVINREDQV